MSEEYDLKNSEKNIGQLYPILVAKDGEIIDGVHRDQADKNWKRIKLDHIDTEEKKLQARLVANFHRRIVPYPEKVKWINDLAEIYHNQDEQSIATKIHETTGIRYQTILTYLDDQYKETDSRHKNDNTRVIPPASERFVTLVGTHRGNVVEAEKLVEEHREEVLAEERPKIEKEIKRELLKDKDFQHQVIEEIRKPQIVKIDSCASGVCDLPSKVESGPQLDVRAETVAKFFQNNRQCKCKGCVHYQKCGAIY